MAKKKDFTHLVLHDPDSKMHTHYNIEYKTFQTICPKNTLFLVGQKEDPSKVVFGEKHYTRV